MNQVLGPRVIRNNQEKKMHDDHTATTQRKHLHVGGRSARPAPHS